MSHLPLLHMSHVSLFLPGGASRTLVLRDISWDLHPGAHTVIYGANGAGKSSLLRLAHGELRPCRGTIAWQQASALDRSRITGLEISALVSPQLQANFQLFSQNLPGRQLLAQAASPDAVEELSKRLGAEAILNMRVGQMSQGQLRLLLLSKAILSSPPLLLLDEWAEGLDKDKKYHVLELLEELAPSLTMVFTCHRRRDLPPFAREKLHLEHGRFVPGALEAYPSHPSPPVSPIPRGRKIFELKNVDVYVQRNLVLRRLNWITHEGEHWRVTGANGAGKSTLLRLLAGFEFSAAGGCLRHFSPRLGRPLTTLEERKRAAPLVSDLSQAQYGYPVSAVELLLTGIDMAEGIHREYTEREVTKAQELLGQSLPELATDPGRPIRRLSNGQLRRLFLARALMGEPETLLLDEPCTGLDAASRDAYIQLLKRLIDPTATRPMQLILVAHEEEDFAEIPFLVAQLKGGELKVI